MKLANQAIANVFITAFQSLPTVEQRAILSKILKMRQWRKDLVDIAIGESRSRERSRPFRTFLSEMKK